MTAPPVRTLEQKVRDTALLVVGIAFAGHEIVVASSPRWEVLALSAAMMGLAGVLRLDEWLKR